MEANFCDNNIHTPYTDYIRNIHFKFMMLKLYIGPITVAVQSDSWSVFARSNAGILGPNPTQGPDVCVFMLSCV
jgi:hypothetical protein